jgi:putative RNA 2'-phosphotransferase
MTTRTTTRTQTTATTQTQGRGRGGGYSMDDKARTRQSKLLSLILRHRPETVGVALDAAGWIEVDVLLRALQAHGHRLTRDDLAVAVAGGPKQRFALSDDGLRIRASQGHSVEVELGYQPKPPPAQLYHGTFAGALDAIRQQGLQRMSRHHVHLSADRETATRVGSRRGRPIILVVDAAAMAAAGFAFYLSANGVWLADEVPVRFLAFPP